MPFSSPAQRKFMYARHPEIAERWSKEAHSGKNEPDRKIEDVRKSSIQRRLREMKGGK